MASKPKRSRRIRLYRRAASWLLKYRGSPYSIAMGFAAGLFVALTPTVGIQMLLGAGLAHLLKANRALPVALAWITNPFTMGPIFYFNYRIGAVFFPADEAAGKAFINAISSASLTEPAEWWSAIKLMGQELWGVAGVLWAGSLIVATIAAAISYPIVWRIVIAETARLERVSAMSSVRPPPPSDEPEAV